MMMGLFSPESILIFITVFILYLYTKKSTTGFKTYPIIGSLPGFILNRHRFLDWATPILRDCPTHTSLLVLPGRARGIITANPENVEHILKSNFSNYPKGEGYTSNLHDLLGEGIFNSDGPIWQFQRKIAMQEFNTKSLRTFVMQIVTVQLETRLIPYLQKASETESTIDLQDVLGRFGFDNVCKLAYNIDPVSLGGGDGTGDLFLSAMEEASTLCAERIACAFEWVWRLKRFLNVGSEKRLKELISIVHAFADKIVRSRLEAKGHGDAEADLLSRFIAAKDDSPEFLRNVVISFIVGGRDTTSAALSWFFWILSSRPKIKEKIVREIAEVREKSGSREGPFGFEDLKKMNYLHAALSETMRLYPPVPVDTKGCLNDDVLPDGTVVKKDWFIAYHSYAMGRMESIWGKDCTEFKPERWLDEEGMCRMESPFRFPVFHGGPRICIGKDMAYIQMKSVAAYVLERFQIVPLNKHTCPEIIISLTMRMKGGLPVRVHPLNSAKQTTATPY